MNLCFDLQDACRLPCQECLTNRFRAPASLLPRILLESMRLHDVRHWHATQLVAANTDIRTVADRLGHADAAFTINTYAHSSSESDRAAAAAIEAFQ